MTYAEAKTIVEKELAEIGVACHWRTREPMGKASRDLGVVIEIVFEHGSVTTELTEELFAHAPHRIRPMIEDAVEIVAENRKLVSLEYC